VEKRYLHIQNAIYVMVVQVERPPVLSLALWTGVRLIDDGLFILVKIIRVFSL